MTPIEKHHQNGLDGLRWIAEFGWLRASELGRLMYPANSSANIQGYRLARSLADRGLLLERLLPARAGRALVLATRGARLLADAGVEARSGKDIGAVEKGAWRPPSTWRHDLLSAQVLVDLYEKGWDIRPEHLLRRTAGCLPKVPDGIAFRPVSSAPSLASQVIWLEVEASRKTGPAMRQLADALATVSEGVCTEVAGHRPTHAVVAFSVTDQDERLYKLDHQARVTAAVAAKAKRDVRVTWAMCQMRNVNVERIEYQDDVIEANRASAVLKVLNAGGWVRESAAVVGHYGGKRVCVERAGESWRWEVGGLRGKSSTLTAAKRSAAGVLAAV